MINNYWKLAIKQIQIIVYWKVCIKQYHIENKNKEKKYLLKKHLT